MLTLRPAEVKDFDFCANLYFAGMEETIRELRLNRATQVASFRQQWAVEQVRIIVRDGSDIGWLQSRVEGDSLFLAQLFVADSFQRQGNGTEVIGRLIDEAGCMRRAVTLGVVKTNPARRLYERLGFRVTREDDRKFYMRRESGT
jgi:ribosomal protein S18 acetylase RimI-like enzyme